MNLTIAELIAAADRRGLRHAFPAGEVNDFLLLSDGVKSVLVNKTKTPYCSAVHTKLVTDKTLSGKMMGQAGLPVAPKLLVQKIGTAEQEFLSQHRELIVKPNRADRGVGVTANVRTVEQLRAAFAKARVHGDVLLEKQVQGREYRILVINGQASAVLERKPLTIVGDGRSKICEIIESLNKDPQRGPSTTNKPLRPIVVAQEILDALLTQGFTLESVLNERQTVRLSFANHLDSGGVACDRTEEAHQSYLDIAVHAARLFSIDVAGIDLICPDIALPYTFSTEAAILEVNPGPDFRWHICPAEGKQRPVADHFVDYLFGQSQDLDT